jgi:hypothetical protein
MMFTAEDAAKALARAEIDISDERYGIDDLRDGMNVELEHGTIFPDLDVTGAAVTSIAIAIHLRRLHGSGERAVAFATA